MNQTGQNIRMLRKQKHLSQAKLAKDIEVAQNTVANYENGKRFPDGKMLVKIAQYFNVTLDELLGRVPLLMTQSFIDESWNYVKIKEQYFAMILEGEEAKAIRYLTSMAEDNSTILQIFETVLTPLLIDIGKMWHNGKLNVSWEHFATYAIDKTVCVLANMFQAEPFNGKKAICLSYSSDPHCMGIKMISEILKLKGVKTYFLGSNIPSNSLLEMLQSIKPDILAISVTLYYHLDGLRNMIQMIRLNEQLKDIKVIVGGQAFMVDSDLWKKSGADAYSSGLRDILRFI